jgi:hypothetical protein
VNRQTDARRQGSLGLLRKYAFAWDFYISVAIGIGVGLAAEFDDELRKSSHLLDVSAALGVAVLGIVIATVSILTVFLTEDYGILLRTKYEDVGEVFVPYELIALTSCATTAVSVLGLFVWAAAPPWAKSVLLGVSLGFAAWSTFGAFSLVRITAGHARLKMRLPEVADAYKQGRERRAS